MQLQAQGRGRAPPFFCFHRRVFLVYPYIYIYTLIYIKGGFFPTYQNKQSSNTHTTHTNIWRRKDSPTIPQEMLSQKNACRQACASTAITLTAVWPPHVRHLSTSAQPPTPHRHAAIAAWRSPSPILVSTKGVQRGHGPSKLTRPWGPKVVGGRAPPLIRPIPKTWADVAASRGASRASTPARSHVEPSYGQDRQAPRRQGSTSTETSVLESVAVLLRNAEASNDPAGAELLRDAATKLLQSNAKQQVNPSSPAQSEPDPLTAARQRVATLSSKVKACVNRSNKLHEQAHTPVCRSPSIACSIRRQ